MPINWYRYLHPLSQSLPRSEQALELLLLGQQPQLEDWNKDIRLRMGLLFVDVPENDLTNMLLARLQRKAAWAKPNLDRIAKSLENRPNGFLKELNRVRDAIERGITLDSTNSSTLHDAFLDDVTFEAQTLRDERSKLVSEWFNLKASVDQRCHEMINATQRLLEQAMREAGGERGTVLREARTLIQEISNSTTKVPPVLSLYHAWCVWNIAENADEAIPFLARAAQGTLPSLSRFFSLRLLAYFSELEGFSGKAYEFSKQAADMRPSADASVEAALNGSALHDPALAKPYVESALMIRSGSIVSLLGDERALLMGLDLFDVAVRVQLRLRRSGRQIAADWESISQEVLEAQRISGSQLQVPFELLDGHKIYSHKLESADMITAGYLGRQARRNGAELRQISQKALQVEHFRRYEQVQQARKAIDSIALARDHKAALAKAAHDEATRRGREAMELTERQAEKIETGALFGFGGGCALLALYLLSYAVLAARGVAVGFSSTIGVAILILAALPIAAAILVQIAAGLKRASIQAKVKDGVKQASKRYDQMLLEADDFYRDQVTVNRRHLAAAETELKKTENAMRHLNMFVANREEPTAAQPEERHEERAEDMPEDTLEEPQAA